MVIVVVVRTNLEQALPDAQRGMEIANNWVGDCKQLGRDYREPRVVAADSWEGDREQLGW